MTGDPAVQAATEAVARLLRRIPWAGDRHIAERAVEAARPIIEADARMAGDVAGYARGVDDGVRLGVERERARRAAVRTEPEQ